MDSSFIAEYNYNTIIIITQLSKFIITSSLQYCSFRKWICVNVSITL